MTEPVTECADSHAGLHSGVVLWEDHLASCRQFSVTGAYASPKEGSRKPNQQSHSRTAFDWFIVTILDTYSNTPLQANTEDPLIQMLICEGGPSERKAS